MNVVKRKKRQKVAHMHNGELWQRLANLIKCEEPIRLGRIRFLCAGVNVSELDRMLHDMVRAGAITVERPEGLHVNEELYRYGR